MRINSPIRGFLCAALAVLALAALPSDSTAADTRSGRRAGPQRVAVRSADVRELARGQRALALDLHRRLAPAEGNFVFSPLGASVVLGMVHEGARGETRRELAAALRTTLPGARLATAFQAVLADVAREREGEPRVAIANALFAGANVQLRPSYSSALRRHYGALVGRLALDPLDALEQINGWAAERTDGLIPEVLTADDLPRDTAMVLANALYFSGDWERPFEERRESFFTTPEGGWVPALLMHAEGNFRTSDGDGYEAVELPYRGGELAMLVVVPDDLESFETGLTPKKWDAIVAGLAEDTLLLDLPPFAIDSELRLDAAIQALGVVRAFDGRTADFSRAAARGTALFLDRIDQHAKIRVDEEGTVAAAVTLAPFGVIGLAVPPRTFRVDRPFLFAIRHRRTGSILFLGRIDDPTR